MDEGYPAIYYQTIRDLGIDPVVCGDLPVTVGPEGCTEEGSARPVQLAAKALAKASGPPSKVPRKRAAKKAAPAAQKSAGEGVVVPKQGAGTTPAKAVRGTAKVASSG